VKVVPPTERKVFMTAPLFRDSNYIIHLSDLHFNPKYHGFPLKRDRAHRTLLDFLEDDIRKIGHGKSPAAVIISGDFTWKGQSEEFDLAVNFLRDLHSLIGLEPEHFVIVPGNHDIQWSETNDDDYDRAKPVSNPPKMAENNYREFFKKFLKLDSNEFLSMGRRYVLGNYVSVDIIGLNSCRLEQKHFAGYGFTGIGQVDKAAESMKWQHENFRAKYRILVIHHHLIPVTSVRAIDSYDTNYSLTLDASQLTFRALDLKVDLFVHGHMHQPFASNISRAANNSGFPHSQSLAIHGTGSTGAKRKYLGSIGKNCYSIYEFDENGITTRIRSRSESIEKFEEEWKCRFSKNPDGGLKLANNSDQEAC
jgi:3',5'-cyclic AMP phosphodiesterase CpdA